MDLQRKIAGKLKEKKGATLVGVLVGMVAIGLLAFPIVRWIASVTQSLSMDGKKLLYNGESLEMQSIIQDYLQQLNASTYEDIENKISAKGTIWTENIGDKYTLKISFGSKGKYAGASCNMSATPGTDDRSCRQATITLASKTDASKMEIAYNTKVSAVKANEDSGDNLPVGTILPYKGSTSNIPEKWALCNGQTVNGGTTPDLSGRFLEGVTSSPGTMKSAGLPNITGRPNTSIVGGDSNWTGTAGTGAFRLVTGNQSSVQMGTKAKYGKLSFDASWSNPIYGASTTVQPPAYTVLYIMKVKA